jgi:pyruvate formate-lyase/glycerol dehydratase family glycyl radical enzyme
MEQALKMTSELSERVENLKNFLVNHPPQLDTERLAYLRDSYKETDHLSAPIRRARLFEKTMLNKTIYIDDNLIVGSLTKFIGGVAPYPEWSCRWMAKKADVPTHLGGLNLTEEDKTLINEAVAAWKDTNIYNRACQAYKEASGVDPIQMQRTGVWHSGPLSNPIGAINLDYGKVLNKGVRGVIEEIQAELKVTPVGTIEGLKKRDFLSGMMITLEATIKNAKRYASLANEMAEKEKNSARKKELKEIAKICERVPENPARNFREAVQSWWFTHVASLIEVASAAHCPGRFSQYMYPFYKKDLDAGKINSEEAIELLGLLFVKLLEVGLFFSALNHRGNAGQTQAHISLGGLTPDGKDATNEIDYLLLETQRRMRVPEPTLSILYHDNMPQDFLMKALEVIRETGLGQPAFFNNDLCVNKLLYHHGKEGITLEEARSVCLVGCIQPRVVHASSSGWEAQVNMPKMLELALNNGVDPKTELQIGPKTGDVDKFKSYDELYKAVESQLRFFMPMARESATLSIAMMTEFLPTVYQSSLIDDCIKNGKDIIGAGARYDVSGAQPVGTVDLGNSLAAIKKLVFDDKRFTMKDLKKALAADFEGHEDIQKMCYDAPKFGNDDDYVDQIVSQLYDLFWVEHQKFPTQTGRPSRPEAFSVAFHNAMGYFTGALPTGRKAGTALTDASVSAMPGTDTHGPTVLVMSAVKAVDTIKWGSNHMNMKFHPSALQSTDGLRKLLALIKTYMDLGGHHVQFNCVSSDTLKDAQKHPENYRDLAVRVAGFSAFFVHLDKGVQDEIIKRSELKFA